MAISKEQWAEIEKTLTGCFGKVDLICDGHTVTASIERDKMKLVVSVYVDGYIKGAWVFNKDGSEIPRKFHQEKKRHLGGTKMHAWYAKQSKAKCWTKEERAEYAAKANQTMSHWMPYWPNAKAFCRHIRKTCTSIEIVKIGY